MPKTLGKLVHEAWDLLRSGPHDTSTEAGRTLERYRLIGLAGLTATASKVITALIGLVSVPLAIGYLGKDQYGLWMLISSLVVWLQLSDFGISGGVANALAEANGKDDLDSAAKIINAALLLSIITAFTCLPLVVAAYWLPWGLLLNLADPALADLAASSFLIIGLCFLASVPLSVAGRAYAAFQLGYITNIFQLASALASLGGLFLGIWLELSMPQLVLLVTAPPVVVNSFQWLGFKRYFPWYRLAVGSHDKGALRRIAQTSAPLFLFQIGALLINQAVNVVIAWTGGLTMVADYNVLTRVFTVVFFVGTAFAAGFYPAIRDAFERENYAWIKTSLRKLLMLRVGSVAIPGMLCIAFGDDLIALWIRQPLDALFGVGGWVLFLSLLVLSSISSTLSEVLTALDKIWPQTVIVMFAAAVVLLGSWMMIPLIGLKGVFAAMLLSTIYPIAWGYSTVSVMFSGHR